MHHQKDGDDLLAPQECRETFRILVAPAHTSQISLIRGGRGRNRTMDVRQGPPRQKATAGGCGCPYPQQVWRPIREYPRQGHVVNQAQRLGTIPQVGPRHDCLGHSESSRIQSRCILANARCFSRCPRTQAIRVLSPCGPPPHYTLHTAGHWRCKRRLMLLTAIEKT